MGDTAESRRDLGAGEAAAVSQVQQGNRSHGGGTDTSVEMIRLPVSGKITAQEGLKMGPGSLH